MNNNTKKSKLCQEMEKLTNKQLKQAREQYQQDTINNEQDLEYMWEAQL